MSSPLVSVLLPVYNAADTLPEALDSLLAQTLADFEIIAVDDGSTDDSGAILHATAARDPRIRPAFAPHAGLIAALNRGLAECRGEFVARMDADDYAYPERLARQAALLQEQPDISVVSCLVETVSDMDAGEGFQRYTEWLNSLVNPEDIERDIFVESPLAHPSAMLRRGELLELGGYQDRGWPEDFDLWLRYHVAGKRMAKVPQVLLRWRDHGDRLTRSDARYSVENFLRAKAHYLPFGPLRDRDAVIIWGAGQMGRRLSKHLIRNGASVVAFLDIDPNKIGRALRDKPIRAAGDLPELWGQHRRPVLLAAVSSHGARQLIRERLAGWGFEEKVDYWCVA